LLETLEAFRPDVVGITGYTVHVNPVRSLFDTVKAWRPDVLTVVGGHHATVVPHDFLSPAIDLIVMGEGVTPFREIVVRRERGAGFDGIPGVAFRANGRLVTTDSAPVSDLDAFPQPARDLTAPYRPHYYSEWMKPLASIRTSKGCPFRCSFCAQWKIAGGRYLKRQPSKIVEELAQIEEEFIFFADDESLVDVARMKELARQVRDARLRKQFFLYGRSDTIVRHPDLLEAWREVGLERVFVGLEFFRDEDLDYIRKGSTVQDNRIAVQILHDLGIEVYASFILRPTFDKEDFAALRRTCRELGLTFATYAVLTPLPGTDLWDETESQLITRNYDYFDFIHTLLPTTLPLKEFYAEYARLLRDAIPLSKSIATLKRIGWRRSPEMLAKTFRLHNQVRRLYRDYEA
jgi:radical SAM superfamily enzyme YgiQ (UPF0313 family)